MQKQLREQTKSKGKAAEEEERGGPGGRGAGTETKRISLSGDLRKVEVGNSYLYDKQSFSGCQHGGLRISITPYGDRRGTPHSSFSC